MWAYKATNQTNATTNLVSDTALAFTAAANTKYAVELLVNVLDGGGNDIVVGKIDAATNAQVIGYWTRFDYANGVFPTGALLTNAVNFFTPEDFDNASTLQKFVVVAPTNTNATVTFQFSKLTNGGSNVIIGAGSYLKAEVIE
jgi:hypothetical protein